MADRLDSPDARFSAVQHKLQLLRQSATAHHVTTQWNHTPWGGGSAYATGNGKFVEPTFRRNVAFLIKSEQEKQESLLSETSVKCVSKTVALNIPQDGISSHRHC